MADISTLSDDSFYIGEHDGSGFEYVRTRNTPKKEYSTQAKNVL